LGWYFLLFFGQIECLFNTSSVVLDNLQMSAAAFAKGLLDLEGELTPIMVTKKKTLPFQNPS
jgi:hypothetical protein